MTPATTTATTRRTRGPLAEMMHEAGFSENRLVRTARYFECMAPEMTEVLGAETFAAAMAILRAARPPAHVTVEVDVTDRTRTPDGRYAFHTRTVTVMVEDDDPMLLAAQLVGCRVGDGMVLATRVVEVRI